MLPAEQHGQPDPEAVPLGHIPTHGYHWPIRGYGDEVGTHYSHTNSDDRTGKLVVDTGHDGLQVDETRCPSIHKPGRNGAGMEAAPNQKEVVTCPEPKTKRRNRKRLLLAAVIGLVILITASVAGGVLGSRQARVSSSSSAVDSQPTLTSTFSATSPTETSTVKPSSLKQGSNLSVVGWRKSQGLQIFLYYLSQTGSLRWSTYDDTQSSFRRNDSYWGESTEVVMEAPQSVAQDTCLAAGIVLLGDLYHPQIGLFYLNSDHELRRADNTNNAAQYGTDSVNDAAVAAATGSYLTNYWPYCAYINRNNEVAVVGNVPYSETQLSPTNNWTVTTLVKSAMPGSRLAIVPLVSSMADLLRAGGYGVFYQDTNGNLVYTQPNREAADANGTLIDSWPTDTEFPSIRLPAGGSFAAFTTARSDSSLDRVNTYVLYQEASSRISMVYLKDDSNWVISQPAALSIADDGTDIACLTMPMTQIGDGGKELDLEAASSQANRCYFQRDGYIREFALSGTDWTELGTIPME